MLLSSLSVLPLLLSGPVAALTEVYSWPGGRAQVDWPNSTWADLYGRRAVTVIGIKVWADKIYLTAPRWHGNVGCLSQSDSRVRNKKIYLVFSKREEINNTRNIEYYCEGNSHPLNVGVLPRITSGASLPLSSPIR